MSGISGRGLTTRKIGEMAQPGLPLFGINTTNGGRIVIFAGGIPLTRDGEVVGAIGVSGGTVDEGHEVAEAGVAAFGYCLIPNVRPRPHAREQDSSNV